MLSGQEATASVDSALSQLGACDLIIDATANPITFNQLSAVACQQKTPLVWLEIFAGGIGGLIARFRPNRDPDPKTMRAYLLSYLAKQEASEMGAASDYAAVSGEGEVIITSDSDVAVIEANATRMALDILVEREPSIFPYSLYLIGLSRGWIFKAPFDTIPIATDHLFQSIIKESNSLTNDALSDNIAFLTNLLEKKNNADPSS